MMIVIKRERLCLLTILKTLYLRTHKYINDL